LNSAKRLGMSPADRKRMLTAGEGETKMMTIDELLDAAVGIVRD
jgi:hypothetical protein